MTESVPVAVIGGGPCGLLAGLLLARAGVDVRIIERHREPQRHPRAMGLTLRTMEIFRQLGLETEITSRSMDLSDRDLAVWSKGLNGEELGRVPFNGRVTPFSPCSRQHCPQTVVEGVLRRQLEKYTGVRLSTGVSASLVEAGKSGGLLKLSDGNELKADWIIAADGAGSPLRRVLHIATDGPGDLGHFLNVQFRAKLNDRMALAPATLYHALGNDFLEFFVSVDGEDLWLMHHFLQPGERSSDLNSGVLREIIRKASGFPDLEVEIIGVSPWVMSPKVAKSWLHGRVCLVGDAAVRLSPAGGLGLNNGLIGVHNLAWKLASIVNGDADSSLIETYPKERQEVSLDLMKHTTNTSDEVFRIVAAAERNDWSRVREAIASSNRQGSRLGLDLGARYSHGAFVADRDGSAPAGDPVNDYLPSGDPGCRAPHLEIESGSLLDLFDGNWVALLGRAGGAWLEENSRISYLQNTRDFAAEDFERIYGIESSGAVLIRPDGVVAARYTSHLPETSLEATRVSILRP